MSVVLITCNRAEMLRDALGSVLAQELPRQEWTFEVVVVDDGSTDGTADLLEAMAAEHGALRIVRTAGVGIPAARNAGAEAARGRWMVCFDDDQIAGAGWLCALREAAEKTRARCFGGALTLLLPDDAAASALGPRTRQILGEHLPMTALRPYPPGVVPATNNAMVSVELFRAAGGFDVEFRQGGSDSEFFERLEQRGETIWFVPAACAQHVMTPKRLSAANLRWTCRKVAGARVQILLKWRGPLAVARLLVLRAVATLLRDWPRLVEARRRHDVCLVMEARCSLWFSQGVVEACMARILPAWKLQHQSALDFRRRNGERVEGAS